MEFTSELNEEICKEKIDYIIGLIDVYIFRTCDKKFLLKRERQEVEDKLKVSIQFFNNNCRSYIKELNTKILQKIRELQNIINRQIRIIKLDTTSSEQNDDIIIYRDIVHLYNLILDLDIFRMRIDRYHIFDKNVFFEKLKSLDVDFDTIINLFNTLNDQNIFNEDILKNFISNISAVKDFLKVISEVRTMELKKKIQETLKFIEMFEINTRELEIVNSQSCYRTTRSKKERTVVLDVIQCSNLTGLIDEMKKLLKILRSIKRVYNKQVAIKNESYNHIKEELKMINNLEFDSFDDGFYEEWSKIANNIKKEELQDDLIYDVYLYFLNGIDNFIDLFVALVSESNRDLLMFDTHSSNIDSIYSTILNAIENYDDTDQSILYMNQGTGQGTLQYDFSPTGKGGNKSKIQIGGEAGNFCKGDLDESSVPNEKQTYYIMGIAKTKDELMHDFHPFFTKERMKILISIYDTTINVFKKRLEQDIRNPEINKTNKFIELLLSYSVGKDSEWNYYTSVLKSMDAECNRLEELTMTKVASIDKYPYLNTDFAKSNGYIKNLNGKDYLYMAIDNTNVEPLFDFKDVCTSVKDNFTADYKLFPLIYNNTDITKDNVASFENSIFDFYYAPGLIDPKTQAGYPPSFFEANPKIQNIINAPGGMELSEYKKLLQEIQLSQDINKYAPGCSESRQFMMDGINAFIRYFGANYNNPDGPVTDPGSIKFVEDSLDGKYIGIQFNVTSVSLPIQLLIGDTTRENISKFVNSFDGLVPLYERMIPNISWKRLHNFAIIIYNLIPDDIRDEILKNITQYLPRSDPSSCLLTEIIITLKSFGDSFQVYYSKKLRDHLKSKIDLYISSTDKNVGGECLLINNTFWLIGTGIRPHSDFFTNYLGFFGKESFKQKAMGLGIIEGETEIDGTVAITTNKSLMNQEKYIESINNTFIKIYPYLDYTPENVDEVTPDIDPIYELDVVLTGISPIVLLLNDERNNMLNPEGKGKFISIINAINRDSPPEDKISKLKELDAFLKKIYEVIKLTEAEIPTAEIPTAEAMIIEGDSNEGDILPVIPPATAIPTATAIPPATATASSMEVEKEVPSTNKSLLFKKLDTLTSFLKMKFALSLKSISKKTIVRDQYKLIEAINVAATEAKVENIFEPYLAEFSRNYLKSKYSDSFVDVQKEYKEMMIKTKEDIEETIKSLIVIGEMSAPTRESYGRKSKINAEEKKLQDKINEEILNQEIKGNTNKGEKKLEKLKQSCDNAKEKLDYLIKSYGERQLKAAENKKIQSAMKLVETSMIKYEEKKKAMQAETAASIVEKAKAQLNTDKQNTGKVTEMITGMLSSMSNQLGKMSTSMFSFKGGGKRKYTRKNNRKLKKKTTRRMKLKSFNITKKNNNKIKIKKTRRFKK